MANSYRTKQREALLNYLVSRAGEHMTVNEIAAYFRQNGSPIGLATIYRHLEKMVSEGILSKYNMGGYNGACFEYIGKTSHVAQGACFHTKCECCGKLYHIRCEALDQAREHLLLDHSFVLDLQRTVFYGVCVDCSDQTEQQERTCVAD